MTGRGLAAALGLALAASPAGPSRPRLRLRWPEAKPHVVRAKTPDELAARRARKKANRRRRTEQRSRRGW